MFIQIQNYGDEKHKIASINKQKHIQSRPTYQPHHAKAFAWKLVIVELIIGPNCNIM